MLLSCTLAATDESGKKQLERAKIEIKKLPKLVEYEKWYSEVLLYIKKFIPDRLTDFSLLYKNDKRKAITSLTYTISDAIIGSTGTQYSRTVFSPMSAYPKLQQQIEILKSIIPILKSKIISYEAEIRADIFDTEIATANGLLQKGFLRATGAICGVIIEKHLRQVCNEHELVITKKDPSINDYNEQLKNNNIIDIPTWRHIQLIADIRNICCHDKKQEPTKEQAQDLVNGTKKIITTVF